MAGCPPFGLSSELTTFYIHGCFNGMWYSPFFSPKIDVVLFSWLNCCEILLCAQDFITGCCFLCQLYFVTLMNNISITLFHVCL